MKCKYGRLPAVITHIVDDIHAYTVGKLPAPPASVAVPNAQFPIDGNEQYGDCTLAGVAHLIAAWNAEVGETDPVPAEDVVVQTYFSMTPDGQDTGLNELDVLKAWTQAGLFGQKAVGFAKVPLGIVDLHQAVALYGGVYLGIQCPSSAQEQFQAGQPWTYEPGSEVEGGHCIVGVGYDANYLYCATWGGVAPVSYPFLSHFLDEAWAVLPEQFVQAGKGPVVDLQALEADMQRL